MSVLLAYITVAVITFVVLGSLVTFFKYKDKDENAPTLSHVMTCAIFWPVSVYVVVKIIDENFSRS